jgi:hypothetical protein
MGRDDVVGAQGQMSAMGLDGANGHERHRERLLPEVFGGHVFKIHDHTIGAYTLLIL